MDQVTQQNAVPQDPKRWGRTAGAPDHAVEIELRCLPALVLRDHVASAEQLGHVKQLPHVVGDDRPEIFHEMRWPLTGTSLPPRWAMPDCFQHMDAFLKLELKHQVHTVRLDQVIDPSAMDRLQIDVQGAVVLVFEGAAARLALLAHHVLRAWDLCHASLQRHDKLSGSSLAAQYLSAMRLPGA